jgi:hypothetical protein
LGVRDSRQNEEKRKKGRARKKKNGGNEWTGPPINDIEKSKSKDCQKYKLEGHGYGVLPKQEVQIAPWEEVAIDLIGPWKVKVNG